MDNNFGNDPMQSGIGGLNAGTLDSMMTDASNAVDNAATEATNTVGSKSGGLKLASDTPVQLEQPMFTPQQQPTGQEQTTFTPQQQPSTGGFSLAAEQPTFTPQQNAGSQPGMNSQPGMAGQQGFGGQNGFDNRQIYGGMNSGMGGGVTPPKKSKKGLIIGISVAVVLIAAIVCFCIFLLPKLLNPRKKIEEAIKSSFETGISITSLQDQVDVNSIAEKLLKDGGTIASELKIDSVSGQDVGVGMNFSFTRDNAAKRLSGDFVMKHNDNKIISADVKADDSKLYLELPELVDGAFTVPTNDILNAFLKSPLLEGLNLDALSVLPAINLDLYQSVNLADYSTDTVFKSELWDKATFKSKGSKKISVNGTEVKAKYYEVTIAEADIEAAISDVVDKAVGVLSGNASLLSGFGIDASQLDATIKQVKAMIPSIVGGDIVLNVYVKDGMAVKIETSGSWNIFGASLDYNVFMDHSDNHIFASATLGAAGQNITLTGDFEGSADSLNGKISLGAAGTSMDMTIDAKASGNNIEGKLSLSAAGQSIDAEFKGVLKDISKTDKFTLEISELTVKQGDNELIKLSGYITLDATNKEAKAVDTSIKQYDLTTLSKDDLTKIMEDNKDKISEWYGELSNLFGGMGDGASIIDDFTGSLDDDGKDPGEDATVEEIDPESINEEIAPEDMVVASEDGKVVVQINGPEGWECFYAGGMVSFMDENYRDLNYTLEHGTDVKAILDERVLLDGKEAEEFEDSKVDSCIETEVDGKKVIYTVGTYKAKPDSSFGDVTITILAAVTEVGDGQYLMVSTTTWSEDGLKIEDVLNGLKSSCYTVQ
ncbi:MAG: hypothetical protein IKO61_06340 [Lachnospiraceae bacterium]|nr:hypothetical protein [Lachnospiraceae bacterium]